MHSVPLHLVKYGSLMRLDLLHLLFLLAFLLQFPVRGTFTFIKKGVLAPQRVQDRRSGNLLLKSQTLLLYCSLLSNSRPLQYQPQNLLLLSTGIWIKNRWHNVMWTMRSRAFLSYDIHLPSPPPFS